MFYYLCRETNRAGNIKINHPERHKSRNIIFDRRSGGCGAWCRIFYEYPGFGSGEHHSAAYSEKPSKIQKHIHSKSFKSYHVILARRRYNTHRTSCSLHPSKPHPFLPTPDQLSASAETNSSPKRVHHPSIQIAPTAVGRFKSNPMICSLDLTLLPTW